MYTLLHGAPPDPRKRKTTTNEMPIKPPPPPYTVSRPSNPSFVMKSLRVDNNEQPHPPEDPKPSSASYLQNASFVGFRSASPQLLTDINRLLQIGLHDLKKKGTDGSVDATLEVYKSVFQRFIDEFNIYRPFLLSVKEQYEKAIQTTVERLQATTTYHVNFAAKDEEHAMEVRDITRQYVSQVNELKESNKSLGHKLTEREQKVREHEIQIDDLKSKNGTLQLQLEEAKSAVGILTRALNNLEAEKAKQDLREQEYNSELSFLNSNLQKSNSDLEKTKREVQDLKELHMLMVTPEEIEKERETVISCRTEIRRLESKLRLQGQRYMMLKVAVDSACRKYMEDIAAAAAAAASGGDGNENNSATPTSGTNSNSNDVTVVGSGNSSQKGKKGRNMNRFKRKQSVAASSSQKDDDDEMLSLAVNEVGTTSVTNATNENAEADSSDALWKRQAILANAEKQLESMVRAGKDPKVVIDTLFDKIESLHKQTHQNVLGFSLRSLQRSRSLQEAGGGVDIQDLLANENQSSNTMDEDMTSISRMSDNRFLSPWLHFEPLGMDAVTVPAYLRSNSKVQNLFLSCRDTVAFVREISAAKIRSDQEAADARARGQAALDAEMEKALLIEEAVEHGNGVPPLSVAEGLIDSQSAAAVEVTGTGKHVTATTAVTTAGQTRSMALENFKNSLKMSGLRHADRVEPDKEPFHIYFEVFLKQKFGNTRRFVEIAYNLIDALRKYTFDSDCRIFLAVLNGEVSENIWNDQKLLLQEIVEEMRKEPHLKGPLFSMTSAAIAAAKEESRKISFDDFLKALRRALPTKNERSHNKLAKALALEVKASRGVDFESVLGISDPPQIDISATVGNMKRPQPPTSGSVATVASKYHEPEAPRYITASNGYVRKNSKFIDLLYLQHLAECIEHNNEIIAGIDEAYIEYVATLAEQKAAQAAAALAAKKARAKQLRDREKKKGNMASKSHLDALGMTRNMSKASVGMTRNMSKASVGSIMYRNDSTASVGMGRNMSKASMGGRNMSNMLGMNRNMSTTASAMHLMQRNMTARKGIHGSTLHGDDNDDDFSDGNEGEDGEGDDDLDEIPAMPIRIYRNAILRTDENKTRNEVNKLLAYCTKFTIEEVLLLEARRTPFPLEDVKKRLRMKVIRKSIPPL